MKVKWWCGRILPEDLGERGRGGTTNIEEDIACLITELFGEKLDPSKAEIRHFLKEKGLRIEDLIKQATKEQLKRCFLGFTAAIEQLEQS